MNGVEKSMEGHLNSIAATLSTLQREHRETKLWSKAGYDTSSFSEVLVNLKNLKGSFSSY